MTNPAENENMNNEETHDLNETMEQQAATDGSTDNDMITLLTKERDDMRDKLMRALAEAENTRKRIERTQADATKYAVAGFAKDMLNIADNLHRALDAITEEQRQDDTVKTLFDGVAATEKLMLAAFEKQGITKIEPTEGKFDPNFHEVMFEAEVPGKQNGEIIQLLEAGYILHDRLLRPARVGVAKSSGNGANHTIDTEA